MIGTERKFVIGRDAACDVVLADPSVSRRHAELLVFADGMLFYTDCASKIGSTLTRDGRTRALHQEVLMPSDRLSIGDLQIGAQDLYGLVRECAAAAGRPLEAALAAPPAEPAAPQWHQGMHLRRCECGAVAEPGQPCPQCGRR
ncbi:FHA domain-containing protein [Piscinibacter sakaiensis]|uniref:FHA domain-containing protein n=1 Tax=Piscinibacter sakaiensis TaxID=1547922 RepID=A0A0K8P3D8_PISS1|nr:FHA domain-containing protein [Piscinibacter sakaiensis]GAP36690.1 hypothetical protein ISF6_2530 [Piscinibacter sakaiensis]